MLIPCLVVVIALTSVSYGMRHQWQAQAAAQSPRAIQDFTDDPVVTITLIDDLLYRLKDPASIAQYKQKLMKQRQILVTALAVKKGTAKAAKGTEAADCADNLRRCAGHGWDLIFDKIGDAVDRYCQKHPSSC